MSTMKKMTIEMIKIEMRQKREPKHRLLFSPELLHLKLKEDVA